MRKTTRALGGLGIMNLIELILEVRDAEEGGFRASAPEHAIFTETETFTSGIWHTLARSARRKQIARVRVAARNAMIYNRTMAPSPKARNPLFDSTRWSVIFAARTQTSPEGRKALDDLCASYWRPLYVFVRRSGRSVEDAQDITQAFFTRLLERDFLENVEPARGRFRAFLLASLKNFLVSEVRHERAAKRGGTSRFLSVEEMTRAEEAYAWQPAGALTPEQIYERNWAMSVLERSTAALQEEFAAAGKAEVFNRLKPFLMGDRCGVKYAQVAGSLGMGEVATRVAVHRMRGRYRDLLRREIARTLSDAADANSVEEEMRHLLTAL